MFALFTLMSLVGKANFRNMSRFSIYNERSFARWYRRGFDFLSMNTMMLKEHLIQPEDELIAVHDASFVSKSGKHTEGLGKFYSGCAGKVLKGLESSGLGIVNMSHNTCYMLDVKQTKDNDEYARTMFYSDHVLACKDQLTELGVTILVGDGYYAKAQFMEVITASGLTLVSKLRRDCDLRYVYEGLQGQRGRPRKYDGKVNFDDLSRFESVEGHCLEHTEVYTKVVYSMITKQKIRVVLLRFDHGGKQGTAVLFSTNTSLSALNIIRYYKARFQIEFCFRDAKQHVGFEDCQSLKSDVIEFHLNASMTTLNLMKLEDRFSCDHNNPKVISILSSKRFKYNQNFLCTISEALGLDQSCQKIRDTLKSLCSFGCIAA